MVGPRLVAYFSIKQIAAYDLPSSVNSQMKIIIR